MIFCALPVLSCPMLRRINYFINDTGKVTNHLCHCLTCKDFIVSVQQILTFLCRYIYSLKRPSSDSYLSGALTAWEDGRLGGCKSARTCQSDLEEGILAMARPCGEEQLNQFHCYLKGSLWTRTMLRMFLCVLTCHPLPEIHSQGSVWWWRCACPRGSEVLQKANNSNVMSLSSLFKRLDWSRLDWTRLLRSRPLHTVIFIFSQMPQKHIYGCYEWAGSWTDIM